ncbi:energy-coupling factor transporter ATPase [Pseudobacteroides cellulosolvens]|uniref:Phosphonate-transporting ATPase n=1 Tax=Pseudobacteroides cellulosolvens ATCC 35603 = DSM 2933 TaxID=398512 RepID=A0A0L6JN57_9FIRM|nr:energy-coupling factor transporter ATPase [Pseudobacteroides cellulosolvens]KNY27236.1 Phosphonate-transporting ATPase [Pseudobacteroides cellulosolvens ATCC 35603 = DSM 2933]
MDKKRIELRNVHYTYNKGKSNKEETLRKIDLKIEQGEFISIIGRNGSGKSTLAKLLNALIVPGEGTVYIGNIDTKDNNFIWEIRSSIGMVFQNPENQIVATSVEEDVAFGPENLGIPPTEMRERVDGALKAVGLYEYAIHQTAFLSGGQKQRVAIAGILAMKPKCIVMDEATSMLDPEGRREVMETVRELNRKHGITIIHISHHMEEACLFDRVIVIEKGSIIMDGKPNEIFSKVDVIKELGLDVPQITELLYELNKNGIKLPLDIGNIEEAACKLIKVIMDECGRDGYSN